MKLKSKLIRGSVPTLKRVAVFAILTCALAGAVAIARSSSDNGEGSDEGRSGYISAVEAQLVDWERTLDELRRGDRQYDSIDSYMLADDLQLAMRDLRGDLLKLQATQSSHLARMKGEIDVKLNEVKHGIAQITSPMALPAAARVAE